MKVKCLYNKLDELPKEKFKKLKQVEYIKKIGKDKPRITLGKEYVVYGIHTALENVWYFICDDDYLYYPVFDLAVFFEITDSRISKYWEISVNESGVIKLWPSSWLKDEYYIDRLTDGEKDIVADFKRIKKEMDEEALG